MEFIKLISFFVYGYAIISITDFIYQLSTPFLFFPLKFIMSDKNYLNFCKVLTCLIYTFVITRFMDYTFDVYPNISFVSRLFFFIIIGSFMHLFLADQLNSVDEKFIIADERVIQNDLLLIEGVFVHLNIIYLFLVFVIKMSIPFLELDGLFNLIPQVSFVKYIVLLIFSLIYARYFMVLFLSIYFAITDVKKFITDSIFKLKK